MGFGLGRMSGKYTLAPFRLASDPSEGGGVEKSFFANFGGLGFYKSVAVSTRECLCKPISGGCLPDGSFERSAGNTGIAKGWWGCSFEGLWAWAWDGFGARSSELIENRSCRQKELWL